MSESDLRKGSWLGGGNGPAWKQQKAGRSPGEDVSGQPRMPLASMNPNVPAPPPLPGQKSGALPPRPPNRNSISGSIPQPPAVPSPSRVHRGSIPAPPPPRPRGLSSTRQAENGVPPAPKYPSPRHQRSQTSVWVKKSPARDALVPLETPQLPSPPPGFLQSLEPSPLAPPSLNSPPPMDNSLALDAGTPEAPALPPKRRASLIPAAAPSASLLEAQTLSPQIPSAAAFATRRPSGSQKPIRRPPPIPLPPIPTTENGPSASSVPPPPPGPPRAKPPAPTGPRTPTISFAPEIPTEPTISPAPAEQQAFDLPELNPQVSPVPAPALEVKAIPRGSLVLTPEQEYVQFFIKQKGLYNVANFSFLRTISGNSKRSKSQTEMLSYQKASIPRSLLKFSKYKADKSKQGQLRAQATLVFDHLLDYMSERPNATRAVSGHEIIIRGFCEPFLRDEIFLQIIKQCTKNPNKQSILLGWRLLCSCLAAFPPSGKFAPYLLCHIAAFACPRYEDPQSITCSSVENAATLCYFSWTSVSKNGMGTVPSMQDFTKLTEQITGNESSAAPGLNGKEEKAKKKYATAISGWFTSLRKNQVPQAIRRGSQSEGVKSSAAPSASSLAAPAIPSAPSLDGPPGDDISAIQMPVPEAPFLDIPDAPTLEADLIPNAPPLPPSLRITPSKPPVAPELTPIGAPEAPSLDDAPIAPVPHAAAPPPRRGGGPPPPPSAPSPPSASSGGGGLLDGLMKVKLNKVDRVEVKKQQEAVAVVEDPTGAGFASLLSKLRISVAGDEEQEPDGSDEEGWDD